MDENKHSKRQVLPQWVLRTVGHKRDHNQVSNSNSTTVESEPERPQLLTSQWQSEKLSFRSRLIQPRITKTEESRRTKLTQNKFSSDDAINIAVRLFPESQVHLSKSKEKKTKKKSLTVSDAGSIVSKSEIVAVDDWGQLPGAQPGCKWFGRLTGIHCVWVDVDHIIDIEEKFNNQVYLEEQTRRVLESKVVRIRDLAIGAKLGQGGNGCVYRGIYLNLPVAVKEMISTKANRKESEAFVKEFEHLKTLKHPNILHFFGAYVDDRAFGTQRRLLVMEFAPHSLRDVIRSSDHPDGNPHAIGRYMHWLRQVAAGLCYIHHSARTIHFDIKPANVLISSSGAAKICDLGVAKLVKEATGDLEFSSSVRAGTPSYMAPELLHGQLPTVNHKADVYSFGIMLWEAFHRQAPHPRHWSLSELFSNVVHHRFRPAIDADLPEPLDLLIRFCWHERPEDRPSMLLVREELEHALRRHERGLGEVVVAHGRENPAGKAVLVGTGSRPDVMGPGQPVVVYSQEAECFLSDGVVDRVNADGSFDIQFQDGQPPQYQVDPLNCLVVEDLLHLEEAHAAIARSQCISPEEVFVEEDDADDSNLREQFGFGGSDSDSDDSDVVSETEVAIMQLREESMRMGLMRGVHVLKDVSNSLYNDHALSSSATASSSLGARVRKVVARVRRDPAPPVPVVLLPVVPVDPTAQEALRKELLDRGLVIVATLSARVLHAYHLESQRMVAVKIVSLQSKSRSQRLRTELQRYLSGLAHPNLVRFLNSFAVPSLAVVVMVFDFQEGGDLDKVVRFGLPDVLVPERLQNSVKETTKAPDSESVVQLIGPLRARARRILIQSGIPVPRIRSRKEVNLKPEKVALPDVMHVVARDIGKALAFLHSKRISHGNVNLSSILFTTRSFQEATLLGLNMSRSENNKEEELHTTSFDQRGTDERALFVAPEVEQGQGSYSADVWGLGMCLLALALKRVPNELGEVLRTCTSKNLHEFSKKKLETLCPDWVNCKRKLNKILVHVVEGCLDMNSSKRLQAMEVVSKLR